MLTKKLFGYFKESPLDISPKASLRALDVSIPNSVDQIEEMLFVALELLTVLVLHLEEFLDIWSSKNPINIYTTV